MIIPLIAAIVAIVLIISFFVGASKKKTQQGDSPANTNTGDV